MYHTIPYHTMPCVKSYILSKFNRYEFSNNTVPWSGGKGIQRYVLRISR